MDINLANVSASDLKAALRKKEEEKKTERAAYKEIAQEVLGNNLGRLLDISEQLSEVKTEIFKNFSQVVQLKTEVYDVKPNQQSHTFTNEKGEGITLGFRVTDGWDDTVNEGVSKVNEYLTSLAKDEDSARLVKTINQLLKKDAKGNLKANRVVELQNLAEDFNNEQFSDGVNIILGAYKPQRSCYFIEAHTVGTTGKKQNIPLSISSAEFANEFEFRINNDDSKSK